MQIDELAQLLIRARGSMGIRAAAKEIGISPTTLSRIERGHLPDLATLNKVCGWIGTDPAKFTGMGELQIAFKKEPAVSPNTAKSLARLIELANKRFAKEIDTEGH
jgi:transcriptional regulator with XRE-family HTH domain